MKVLVTGAGGQLGYDVCRELARRGIENRGADVADFDITDAQAVRAYIGQYAPDAVVHCAAYTAVDRAEEDAARAFSVNEGGTRNIAAACAETGAKMVYISTDYVFGGEGERFYEPSDAPAPLGVYGKSKYAGELAARSLVQKLFVVRISWVFGMNGGNFVKTMLRLAGTHESLNVVGDQFGSPTYTADLAPLLCDMLAGEKYGTYHATNEGVCSWAEFAREIFRLAGRQTQVRTVTTAEYGAKAPRPHNSRLSKACLDAAGFTRLPPWQDALARYLRALAAEGK